MSDEFGLVYSRKKNVLKVMCLSCCVVIFNS